ncbi:hypothetical protein I551_2734, partial [Mycobacterium ulcerans str. Harvey]
APALLISRLVSWLMIFGARYWGRSVGTGYLENDRVGYCSSLVWSCRA